MPRATSWPDLSELYCPPPQPTPTQLLLREDALIGARDLPVVTSDAHATDWHDGQIRWSRRNRMSSVVADATRYLSRVIRGLDPRIHRSLEDLLGKGDGWPGQARP